MPATLEIRPIDDGEFEACERMKAELFSIPFAPERLAQVRSIRELDRIYVACADRELVGSIAANSFTIGVPGGKARVAGISGLGLRAEFDGVPQRLALLERQLRAARDREEPLAALCALLDVPPVYDQVGFAIASKGLDLEIDAGHAVIRDTAGDPAAVREACADDLLAAAQASYLRLGSAVPGVVERNAAQWNRWAARYLKAGTRYLIAGPAGPTGQPEGYAVVTSAPASGTGDPTTGSPTTVRELVATHPRAALALWSAVFAAAGGQPVRAAHRPADDPLQWLLADPRKLRRTVAEGIWMRLVDVPAALRARAYASPVDVVLRISDSSCPWNDGTFRLTAAGADVTCRPSADEPALAVEVEALGAAYLGSVRLSALAGTGLVTVFDASALRVLDTALSWPVAAWAPNRF